MMCWLNGFVWGLGVGLCFLIWAVHRNNRRWQACQERWAEAMQRSTDLIKRQNALWGEWHVKE